MKSLTYLSGIALVFVSSVIGAGEVRVTTPSPAGMATYQTTVVVTDSAGEVVSGLTADRFLVTVNQEVTALREVFPVTSQWLAVALLIDKSGSMKGDPLDAAKEAADDFVHRCSRQTLYAVMPFDDGPVPGPNFRQREQGVLSAIAAIEPGNDTSLYDAILTTLPYLASYWPPRKAMIVLTDGKDTKSLASYDDLLAEVREQSVPIYTVGLGSDLDEEKLDTIARMTKGRYFHAPKPVDLLTLYRTIASELDQGYVVQFELPSELPETGTHVLEVTVAADSEAVTGRQLFDMTGELLNRGLKIVPPIERPTPMAPLQGRYAWATIVLGFGIGLVAGVLLLLVMGRGRVGFRYTIISLSALLGGLVGALYRLMK